MVGGENRKISFRKALRKKRISDRWYPGESMYDNLHEYSKGKIHCGCGMCSAKTRNKGRKRLVHGNYAPSVNYKASERRKQDSLDSHEDEEI